MWWAYAVRHPALYAGAIASLFLFADARRPRRLDLVVRWVAALFIFVLGRSSFTYHFAIAMIPAALALGGVIAAPPRRLRTDTHGVAALLFTGVIGTATTQALAHGRALVVIVVMITAIWLPILVLAAMVAGRTTPVGWRAPAAALLVSAGGVLLIADLEPWSRSLAEVETQDDLYRSRIEGIEDRFLRGHDQVLLLAYGTVAYHLDDTASACRHYFPIPLQRTYREGVSDTGGYEENLNCALSYTGDYVLLEPTWIDTTLVPELDAYLEDEFVEVASRRARRSVHKDQLVVLRRLSSTPSGAPDSPP